jgi:DNA-directed RNA polymerase subunit K/omega
MARITVEDCLEKVSNRFEPYFWRRNGHASSREPSRLLRLHREIVTALREIAAGKVRRRETSPS